MQSAADTPHCDSPWPLTSSQLSLEAAVGLEPVLFVSVADMHRSAVAVRKAQQGVVAAHAVVAQWVALQALHSTALQLQSVRVSVRVSVQAHGTVLEFEFALRHLHWLWRLLHLSAEQAWS